MKSLNEDIKSGKFKNVYLLYGEEAYLKKQYKDRMTKAIIPDGDTMNYAYYEGKGINPAELVDLAETMPFFAERRLIVAENSGFFKNATPELADYIKSMPDTTCLLFIENEVDKRGKMYKAVKKAGRAVEFARQADALLMQWALGRMKRENKKITQNAMQLFLEKTGNDMENIDRELEKLFCYTLGKDAITAEDVENICTGQTTGKIFEMVNHIAEGRKKQALELYYDLLALKEPPMRILFLVARQFQILFQVKELGRQGHDRKFIASKAGIPEFSVNRNLAQAGRFTLEGLKSAVAGCVQAEEDIKTGNMDAQMAVELLVVSSAGAA